MTPQEIAQRVGVGMMAQDHASQALGMRLTHISPGAAHIDMTVRRDMLNGFGTCHGGMITALADSPLVLPATPTTNSPWRLACRSIL